MKNKITERDYIKAHRKAAREEEIALYGHPLPKARVHESKRTYNRNKEKAAMKSSLFYLPPDGFRQVNSIFVNISVL